MMIITFMINETETDDQKELEALGATMMSPSIPQMPRRLREVQLQSPMTSTHDSIMPYQVTAPSKGLDSLLFDPGKLFHLFWADKRRQVSIPVLFRVALQFQSFIVIHSSELIRFILIINIHEESNGKTDDQKELEALGATMMSPSIPQMPRRLREVQLQSPMTSTHDSIMPYQVTAPF